MQGVRLAPFCVRWTSNQVLHAGTVATALRRHLDSGLGEDVYSLQKKLGFVGGGFSLHVSRRRELSFSP